jgi:toxin ParE1/3/4
MSKYKLSNVAKEDLISIHHYGVKVFGVTQADKYFDSFFEYFESIAQQPFSFESVDHIKI